MFPETSAGTSKLWSLLEHYVPRGYFISSAPLVVVIKSQRAQHYGETYCISFKILCINFKIYLNMISSKCIAKKVCFTPLTLFTPAEVVE